MKYSLCLSLLLSSTIFFNGCDSSSDSESQVQTPASTTISGKTTLSNGYVCLDTNQNETCDSGEANATTSDDGAYSITVDGGVEDGTLLIAKDGYNLVLLQNNLRRIEFYASYQDSETQSNINTMTTLIYKKMKESMSYEDSKSHFASKYNIAIKNITADPIEAAKTEENLFKVIHATEEKIVEDAKANASAKSFRFIDFDIFDNEEPADTNTSATEGDTDAATEDGSYLDFDMDNYLELLNKFYEFIEDIINNIYEEFFGDDSNNTSTLPSNAIAARDDLNGIWYIVDRDTNTSTCTEIDALDNLKIHTKDALDEYTLDYDAGNRQMDILYGYSTVETFYLTSFSTNAFQATHSEGVINALREETLSACQTKL